MVVTSVAPGSVVVDFYIAPAADGSALVAADAVTTALAADVSIAGATLTADSVSEAPTVTPAPETPPPPPPAEETPAETTPADEAPAAEDPAAEEDAAPAPAPAGSGAVVSTAPVASLHLALALLPAMWAALP